MIKLAQVSKQFGPLVAIHESSLEISGTGVWGLLGKNGAGKTTLLDLLAGVIAPNAGEILIGGKSYTTDAVAIKRGIGYLPQRPGLYPELSVKDSLFFCAELKQVPLAKRVERIEELVSQFSLNSEYLKSIRKLSKGFRQRVSWAQAIMTQPQLLLLDEPSSGLDLDQQLETQQIIQSMGKTSMVILSSHSQTEIKAVCHQIIGIEAGRLSKPQSIQDWISQTEELR